MRPETQKIHLELDNHTIAEAQARPSEIAYNQEQASQEESYYSKPPLTLSYFRAAEFLAM